MRETIIRLLSLIAVVLLCVFGAGCDDNDTDTSSSSSESSSSESESSSSEQPSDNQSPHEHVFVVHSKVEVSCFGDGYTIYACTGCGETKHGDTVKSQGHVFGDYQIRREATLFELGEKYAICTVCWHEDVKAIPRPIVTVTYSAESKMEIKASEPISLTAELFEKDLLQYPNMIIEGTIVPTSELKAVTLGENIVKISGYAFTGDFSSLTEIVLSPDIEKIELAAFNDCDNLERVKFLGDAPELGYKPFTKRDGEDFEIEVTEGAKFDGVLFGEMKIERPWLEKPDALDISSMSTGQYASLASVKALWLVNQIVDLYEKNGQDELIYFPYSKDLGEYAVIREFALELTKDCTIDKEKIDTVYDWIVENIIYDDNATKHNPYQTLTTKRAVCAGYTTLMYDMLSALEIKTFYVRTTPLFANPYTVTDFLTIDRGDIPSHATLAVEISDGEYAFYDPTYGASDKEQYRCMNAEAFGDYMVAFSVNGIEIVLDGIDYTQYKIPGTVSPFLYEDGYIYSVSETGEIFKEENNADYYNYWFAEAVFVKKEYSNYKVANGNLPLYSVYNCGIITGTSEMCGVYFSLADGRTYDYVRVAEYIKFQNENCSKNISVNNGEILDLDGMVFTKFEDHYALSLCYKNSAEIVVPSTVNGLSVTEIAVKAFFKNNSVKRIIIEDGIEQIWVGAFYECQNLEYLYLPKSVKYNTQNEQNMGTSSISFERCYNLKEIVVHVDSPYFTSLDGNLYSKDMKELIVYAPKREGKSFIVPASVEKIAAYAFAFAEVESVTLPSGLKRLGDFAFEYSKLKSIEIPGSAELGNYCLAYATHLERATLGEGITATSYGMFTSCQSLIEVVFPSTIKTIGEWSFNACSRLYKLDLPEGVVKIETHAFVDSSLVSITLPSTLAEIGEEAFLGARVRIINNLSSLALEKESESFGGIALVALEINDTVDNSSLYVTDNGLVFYSKGENNFLMEYIAMGESELVLPALFNGKEYQIFDKAFADTYSFGWIKFEACDIYEWLEDGTHSGESIKSIVLPNTIKSIPLHAFTGWEELEYIYFEGTEQEWNEIYVEITNGSNAPILNATVIFNS